MIEIVIVRLRFMQNAQHVCWYKAIPKPRRRAKENKETSSRINAELKHLDHCNRIEIEPPNTINRGSTKQTREKDLKKRKRMRGRENKRFLTNTPIEWSLQRKGLRYSDTNSRMRMERKKAI